MILITGGMGFIGLNSAKALLRHGENAILTTSTNPPRELPILKEHLGKRLFIEVANATNGDAIMRVADKHSITGILHMASPGFTGPPAECALQNVQSLISVFQAGQALGVKRILLASSIAVYAGVEGPIWREDATFPMASPFPMTAYKKVFEIYGDFFAARTKISVVSARLSAYGPLQRGMFFPPPQMTHSAIKGIVGPEVVPGHEPPYEDYSIDYGYIDDVADALARLQIAPTLKYSTYNVAGGRSLSARDFAHALVKAVPNAKFKLRAAPGDQPPYPALDLSRLKEDVDWTPQYDVESGIAAYVAWLKAGNPF